jgi:hypothetical protein
MIYASVSGWVFVLAAFYPQHAAAQTAQRNDLLEKGVFIQVPGPNPILRAGDNSWESFVIETAGIFKDFGTYYLYYHAAGGGTGYQVGVATSKHPLGPFKKHEGNPILELGDEGGWEDKHVACAIIIKEGLDNYYMWYCGQGSAGKKLRPDSTGNIWDIGLATASHPLGPWKKYEGNPIIPDFGYNSATVKVGGKYYMYSAHPIGNGEEGSTYPPDYSPMKIATAEAPEGPWVVQDEPILHRGEWGEWDDGGFSDAAVVYHSGVFHMFQAGAKGYDPRPTTRESVGYAYSFDGFNFIEYGLNPIATREANPNAAAFSEPRVLIEFPYIYIYHTLRYKEEFGPHVGHPMHEDIGVQVIATQRPFSLDMPVLVAENLAAGTSTKLEDSPPVCLSHITGVSLTAQCTYDKEAKMPIRVHVVSSTDGLVYDTTDLFAFENDFKPGETARKTVDLNTNVRFMKIMVENQDKSNSVSELKITATLKG